MQSLLHSFFLFFRFLYFSLVAYSRLRFIVDDGSLLGFVDCWCQCNCLCVRQHVYSITFECMSIVKSMRVTTKRFCPPHLLWQIHEITFTANRRFLFAGVQHAEHVLLCMCLWLCWRCVQSNVIYNHFHLILSVFASTLLLLLVPSHFFFVVVVIDVFSVSLSFLSYVCKRLLFIETEIELDRMTMKSVDVNVIYSKVFFSFFFSSPFHFRYEIYFRCICYVSFRCHVSSLILTQLNS